MIDREWMTDIKVERRNCGRARAITIMVEPPENSNYNLPRYRELISLIEEVYHGTMKDDGRVISSADVMAWSDKKRNVYVPNLYRVTAVFAYPEDLRDAEPEE